MAGLSALAEVEIQPSRGPCDRVRVSWRFRDHAGEIESDTLENALADLADTLAAVERDQSRPFYGSAFYGSSFYEGAES